MNRLLLSMLSLTALSTAAIAGDDGIAERWECKLSAQTDWDEVIVIATIDDGHKTGSLWAAGVDNQSLFQVKGLERVWSFTPNDRSGYDYTFIVSASKKGKFYDFSKVDEKTPEASIKTLDCRRDD